MDPATDNQPIFRLIGEKKILVCELSSVKHHLAETLRFTQKDVNRIAARLEDLLQRQIEQNTSALSLAIQDINTEVIQLILLTLAPRDQIHLAHWIFSELMGQDVFHVVVESHYAREISTIQVLQESDDCWTSIPFTCRKKSTTKTVLSMPSLVDQDQRYKLIGVLKDELGYKPQHYAVARCSEEILCVVRDTVSRDSWIQILDQEFGEYSSYLHYAVHRGQNEVVRITMQPNNPEQRHKLLQKRCRIWGETPLHLAFLYGHTEILQIVKGSFRYDQDLWMQLMLLEAKADRGCLHYAMDYAQGAVESVKLLLSLTNRRQRYQLLQMQDSYGFTPAHYAASNNHNETLTVLKNSVDNDQWRRLMSIRDVLGRTCIHLAMVEAHADIVALILSTLKLHDKLDLLSVKENNQLTAIDLMTQQTQWKHVCTDDYNNVIAIILRHVNQAEAVQLLRQPFRSYALNHGYDCETMKAILDHFTPHHQLILIGESDQLEFEVTQQAKKYDKNVSHVLKLLREYRTQAKISVVTNTTDVTARHIKISEIVQLEGLSMNQIQELSPYGNNYVIPFNQQKAKRYALIYYNAEDRFGAHDEADTLEMALNETGCEVIREEWNNVLNLAATIVDCLDTITADCSLLVVCIMAHGRTGMISGTNNSEIPIDDILHLFKQYLPQSTPLIVIIQACQSLRQPSARSRQSPDRTPPDRSLVDANMTNPAHRGHIELVRPHSVLLLASVMGGEAVRGALTSTLAYEFRESDGKRDILTMFTRAVARMKECNPDCEAQTPECRSTLQKHLVLPQATNEEQRSSFITPIDGVF